MGVEDARPAGVFQPDQESKVFLHRFFLHPLLKKYGSYVRLFDEGKKEMREQILLGISKKKIRVASTVQLYTSALKKIMGIAQSVEIEEGRGEIFSRSSPMEDFSTGSCSSSRQSTISASGGRRTLRRSSWTGWCRAAPRSTHSPP